MPNPNPKNPQPSIKDKGLAKHINALMLKRLSPHRYKHFVDLMESTVEPKVPNVERMFGVSRLTAVKWIDAYKEQGSAK